MKDLVMETDEALEEMVMVEIVKVPMNMAAVLTLKMEVMPMDETKGQDQRRQCGRPPGHLRL